MGLEYSKNVQYSVLEQEVERKEEIIDSYKTMITEQNKIIDELKQEVTSLKDKINRITNLVDSIRRDKYSVQNPEKNNTIDFSKKSEFDDSGYGFTGYSNKKNNKEIIENDIFQIETPLENEPLEF